MQRVLVVNRKGGVGKTTIADELLFSFERSGIPSAYIDLDDQNSSIHADSTSDSESADVVVVDTPGAFNPAVADWMRSSDIIIIPSNPSGRDIPMLMTTLETAREVNPKAKIIIAVNRFNKFKASAEFLDAVRQIKESCEDVITLPQSESFQKAYLNKRSIIKEAPKNAAALRTLQAVNVVRRAMNLPDDPTDISEIERALAHQQELANMRRESHNG